MSVLSGIYKITNTLNGRVYIGSACNLSVRKSVHLHRLRNNKHHSKKLQNSWNKHGESSFVFSTLLICKKEDLLFYEQRAINAYEAATSGYNICQVAGNCLGVKHGIESLKAFKAAAAKRIGVPLSAEHRAKLSLIHAGKKQSPEHIEARAATRRGVPQPKDQIQRRTERLRGIVKTQESIEKWKATKSKNESLNFEMTGLKRTALSIETRQKISASLIGKPMSQDRLDKQKAGIQKWKAAKLSKQQPT